MSNQPNDVAHSTDAIRQLQPSLRRVGQLRASQSSTVEAQIVSVREEATLERLDWLATEEPLEIRVAGPKQAPVSIAVTMRTPGHDAELAVGFLYTEGLIRGRDEIATLDAQNVLLNGQPCNVATVHLTHDFDSTRLQRNFYATSSCGICGKASLEQIAVHCEPVADGFVVPGSVLHHLPATLRQAQDVFAQTGGLHASGLFDRTGTLVALREDVGRHNAVDKVVGHHVLAGDAMLANYILMVSGRVSFEIMQKAAMARVPILCAVSAPSSLAVAVAQRFRMTVVGFLRDQGFNIYTHPERVALAE